MHKYDEAQLVRAVARFLDSCVVDGITPVAPEVAKHSIGFYTAGFYTAENPSVQLIAWIIARILGWAK